MMVIIAGHLLMNEGDRDTFVAANQDLVRRARAFDGCIEIAITADSVDPRRVNTLEVWRDSEALDTWRQQANDPDLPIQIEREEVKRYDATDGGPLF